MARVILKEMVLQPLNKYFKVIINTDYVSSWKSKGLSAETIKPPTRSDNSLNPALNYYGNKTRVKFTGSCLQQPNISYTHEKVVNIYIAYELGASSSHEDDTTLENCLFCAVTLTKNADIDKYGYLGYDIGFYRKSNFSFPNGGFGQNVIIFGVDMGSSAHIHNKKKHSNSWERSNTKIRTYTNCRKNVLINFTVTKKKFCLSLHYNGGNSYLFVNGTEIYKFKAKDS